MGDEYIKKEDAVKAVANAYWHGTDCECYAFAHKALDNVQNADVAPVRHGHWIYDRCDIVCSECGTAFSDEVCYMMRDDVSYHEPRHCLWCGARMEGDTK